MEGKNLSFKDIIKMTENIIERFEKIEEKKWGAEGAIIEMQKQVGELAKYIMIAEKYYFLNRFEKDHKYAYDTVEENIGDELSDILYAIIRLAKHYNIDLEKDYVRSIEAGDKDLKSKGV